MVCANLCAAACSRGRSFFVLRLVSIASTIERGNADSRLKIAIFCSLPSSFSAKFSFCRLETGPPWASVTVTKTLTSFTSDLKVVSGSRATEARVVAPVIIRTSQRFFMRGQSFGCGLPFVCARRARDFFRERLPIRPNSAAFEVFLFPDRHGFLEGIDDPPARVEGRPAVSRRNNYQYAGLPDFQTSKAVHQGNLPDRKLGPRLLGQRIHLLERHRLVSFVIKEEGTPPAGIVANHTLEDHCRAILRQL